MITTYDNYIIEPKNNCVVCKMKITSMDDYYSWLMSYLMTSSGSYENYKVENEMRKFVNGKKEYIGVARLKNGDKCDFEKGKKIAKYKALRAFYREYAKLSRQAEEIIYNKMYKIQKYTDGLVEHTEYLNKVIKEIAYDKEKK